VSAAGQSALSFLRRGDIVSWVVILALAADASALASVWISRGRSRRAKTLWTVVVILLPLIGAAAWLAFGRERRHARRG
jgi:Phospholipase_D-nuclease N-terminal